MSSYAVILKEEWDSSSAMVHCYFVTGSLQEAMSHEGDVVKEGDLQIQHLPRASFKYTGSQINLTVVDINDTEHSDRAVICVSR